jgi:hypothetical protein
VDYAVPCWTDRIFPPQRHRAHRDRATFEDIDFDGLCVPGAFVVEKCGAGSKRGMRCWAHWSSNPLRECQNFCVRGVFGLGRRRADSGKLFPFSRERRCKTWRLGLHRPYTDRGPRRLIARLFNNLRGSPWCSADLRAKSVGNPDTGTRSPAPAERAPCKSPWPFILSQGFARRKRGRTEIHGDPICC